MKIANVMNIIEKALEENLEPILLMLIVVTSLYLIDILFGTIVGTKTEKFILDKFIHGFIKLITSDLGIFVFCYTLNLFCLTLQITKDIIISQDFITTVEVFTILVVWAIDLAKEVIEKIKTLKTLKYTKYEDVSFNDYSVDERG